MRLSCWSFQHLSLAIDSESVMSFKIVLLCCFVTFILPNINAEDYIYGYEAVPDPTPFTSMESTTTKQAERKQYALGVFFKANWFRAAQYCRFKGMALASIHDETEEEELEAAIEKVGFELTTLWTSGADFAEDGKYFWMYSGQPITYSKWFTDEPNGGLVENCVSVSTRGGQGYAWHDAPCTDEHHFVCEYYPSVFINRLRTLPTIV